MSLYPQSKNAIRILVTFVAILTNSAALPSAFSKDISATITPSEKQTTDGIVSRARNKQPASTFKTSSPEINPSRDLWNSTTARSSGKWTPSIADGKKPSNIRFASASGLDEGNTSAVEAATSPNNSDSTIAADKLSTTAAEATTATTVPDATAASDNAAAAPSVPSASVKEQLLNALRMQREAMDNPNASKSTTPQGSLTIMNSPKVVPKLSANPSASAAQSQTVLSPTIPSLPTDQTDMSTAGNETGMQPKSAKSYAGLTRTLEEDLKSSDPYLRERAQRFLRLQLQLLKLRSRQAAASEITTQNSAMDAAGDSIPLNSIPVNPQTTSPENQSSEPLSNPKTGSDEVANRESLAEPPSTNDDMQTPNPDDSNQPISPVDNIRDDNMSGDTNVAATEPSANASLLENVVIDGPIDRLGLANNLFAVGEYPLALEMYQETKGPELSTQQQFWVEYQTANCYRRLGNPAEASNRYRKLASQSEAGWLSRQAHWWVETLESIRILEKALKDNSVQVCQKVIENAEAEVIETPAETTALTTVPATSQTPEPVNNEHAN